MIHLLLITNETELATPCETDNEGDDYATVVPFGAVLYAESLKLEALNKALRPWSGIDSWSSIVVFCEICIESYIREMERRE